MTEFPWDITIILALGLAGVTYIIISILVYASRE
jgi:hypothetical protein